MAMTFLRHFIRKTQSDVHDDVMREAKWNLSAAIFIWFIVKRLRHVS